MHPTSLLFTLASLFLFHQRVHAECEPMACGNFTIKYPFWLGAPSRPAPEPSCGHPAFELWCSGSNTSASMRGSAIQVLSIDYGASSFVASHSRFSGSEDGVCRADFNMSSSLALSSFKLSPSNMALCLLFNCNGTEPRGPAYVNATRSCGIPIYAYLGGRYDWVTPPAIPTGSCTYTYLPVLASEAAISTAANYSRLLKDGFILDWAGTGSGDCHACVASGGECRYSSSTAEFACLCRSAPAGGMLHGPTCAGGEKRGKKIMLIAKLCHTKESNLSMTGARGTIGFIAPEVHSRTFGVVSTKSDVYSYGMMLLEMVGGRRNVKSIVAKSSEKYFPDWIYDHFAQDDGLQACEVTGETEEIARKMTLIGLWCVQILPAYRPTITKVLEMFERSSNDMDMPPKQNFSGLLESSAHNMDVQSSSSTRSEEISLVNSKILQKSPTL
nr:LEAF RUST 10 DISEASE-RESISTANCE LOCUS RECEPTOR-LIKE PROTEIN KINASE-like 2.7 isoform X3 [Aegilops tauschii subsp. strangulata]